MTCSPRADNTDERRKMFRSTKLAMKQTVLAFALATLAAFVAVRMSAVASNDTPSSSLESVRALPLSSRAINPRHPTKSTVPNVTTPSVSANSASNHISSGSKGSATNSTLTRPFHSADGLAHIESPPSPSPPVTAQGASEPPRYFFATRSTNWAGYGTTSLESLELFHSISARWIVPRIEPGSSIPSFGAQWIGIGGNCILPGCLLEDPTLVQTGTLEEVSPSGKHIYQAWYEMLPNPSIPIPKGSLTVRPGDHMLAQLTEAVPGIWNLKISNLTNGGSFQTSVLLGSLGLTAEWIEEAPTVQSPGAPSIQSSLPHLTRTLFYDLHIDGQPATLSSPQRITLIGPRGNLEASTSMPGPNGNSFAVCPYTTTCPAP
jgi:hypothetical protein